ncbi:MAG: helix-turn-helix domain-containing protein, partial [Candidatus Corynebacterium faecigallinarum]
MVRRWRRWEELSQAELAERVGVSRQTIANI